MIMMEMAVVLVDTNKSVQKSWPLKERKNDDWQKKRGEKGWWQKRLYHVQNIKEFRFPE